MLVQFYKLQTGLSNCIWIPDNGTVLTLYGDTLIFKTPNYLPDDNQLWYIDDQPDGSCMIVRKGNRKVLACTSENESEIVIKERCGGENQKWLLENGDILSLKYHTVMCGRKHDSQAIHTCIRERKIAGCHSSFCCLQPSVS